MSLVFKNVVKREGADIHIHDTSFELRPEGFNILLGATLAGKTTLMRLMAGLVKPTSGEVWFDGKNVTGLPVQKRNVSMVHQQFINYPNFSVFENIASPLRVAGVSGADISQRVEQVAELLKLTPMLKRRPNELSGGQQQRTALARALVKDADLVLLDEPLANLDFKLREELREELPKLFKDRGCTVVYATSEPIEALLLGGHTATLHEGRVTQFGDTGKIYRQPGDLITAEVFSDPPINTAPGEKRGERLSLANGVSWELPPAQAALQDGAYTVAVRPHHVGPLQDGAKTVPIVGKVLITELSGSESVVHIDFGGRTWVSQSHGIHPIEVGDDAQLYLDAGRCMLFDQDQRLVSAGQGAH